VLFLIPPRRGNSSNDGGLLYNFDDRISSWWNRHEYSLGKSTGGGLSYLLLVNSKLPYNSPFSGGREFVPHKTKYSVRLSDTLTNLRFVRVTRGGGFHSRLFRFGRDSDWRRGIPHEVMRLTMNALIHELDEMSLEYLSCLLTCSGTVTDLIFYF